MDSILQCVSNDETGITLILDIVLTVIHKIKN